VSAPPAGAASPVRARAAAVAAAVAGAALCVLPTLTWYVVETGGRTERATGLAGSGELWILPVLGALALAGAAALLLGEPDEAPGRAVGAGLAALGALGVFWALRNLVDPPVVLTLAGAPEAPLPAEPDLAPAGVAAPVVAGALLVAGLVRALPGRRG
jgi:hypothetical protein